MQLFFLVCEEGLEWLLELTSDDGNECYQINSLINQLFAECHNDDDLLKMHFNHSLADKSRTEEGPEWHQKVTARDSREIKKWVGNLKKFH